MRIADKIHLALCSDLHKRRGWHLTYPSEGWPARALRVPLFQRTARELIPQRTAGAWIFHRLRHPRSRPFQFYCITNETLLILCRQKDLITVLVVFQLWSWMNSFHVCTCLHHPFLHLKAGHVGVICLGAVIMQEVIDPAVHWLRRYVIQILPRNCRISVGHVKSIPNVYLGGSVWISAFITVRWLNIRQKKRET